LGLVCKTNLITVRFRFPSQIGCIAVWYISRFIEARTILFAALQHRRPGTAQGLVPFTGWRFFILSFEF